MIRTLIDILLGRRIKRYFHINGEPYMNTLAYKGRQQRKYIKFMSPKKYIKEAAGILGLTPGQAVASRLNDNSYTWILDAALKGKLTIPMLDYVERKQDGLHRVIWAKKQGLRKIPVFVYKR